MILGMVPVINKCVRRPHAILLCAGVLLASGLVVSCTGKRVSEATVKMQSTSPDGKYRCVVKEQLPPAGYNSPHVYTFTVILDHIRFHRARGIVIDGFDEVNSTSTQGTVC